MAQTGLLPCVSWAAARWWLPLSHQSASVIAQLILGPEPPKASVTAVLRQDPAFRIWALIEFSDIASVDELANKIVHQVPDIFSKADRFLGAPSDLSPFQNRWCQLSQEPVSVQSTADWLALTGPTPPDQWREGWRSFERIGSEFPERSSHCHDYGNNTLDLRQLASIKNENALLKQSFAQSLASEKVQAMREFTYGLTHEINNPLANISTRAGSLLRGEERPDERRFLQAIIDQAMRAYEMLADAMFYAKPSGPLKSKVPLGELIDLVASSFEKQWAQSAIVFSRSGPNVPLNADRDQITEALRALLRNATEAIGAHGNIHVETLSTEDSIELRIRDNGPGLTVEQRKHAFDPFYSGREAGRGLGLGLCKAQRIIELHGGSIKMGAERVGATVIVRLPRTPSEPQQI